MYLTCSHPHNVDADQHIDGIIVWNSLEHAKSRVISSLLRDIIRKRHFINTQGPLGMKRHNFSPINSPSRFWQQHQACDTTAPVSSDTLKFQQYSGIKVFVALMELHHTWEYFKLKKKIKCNK